MSATSVNLQALGAAAKAAARGLALASTEAKNRALEGISAGLLAQQEAILSANGRDCAAAKAGGLSEAMLDRLLLNPQRLAGMAADVCTVALLPDPVGEYIEMRTLPNGMQVGRVRVPLGVIAAIYESRPNVTVDIASLCLKSGNAVILRGGREALRSNAALASVVQEACRAAGLPEGAVQFVDDPDRARVAELLRMKESIDLMVPRGGAELIRYVAEQAAMPVVAGGIGVCHTYVDVGADQDKALRIVHNAKVRRPTICNALDTVLVHRGIAGSFLPRLAEEFARAGVEMRCDPEAYSFITAQGCGTGAQEGPPPTVLRAVEEDWGKEFLALVAAIKVVDSLDDALAHIQRYGSGHSEAIVTEDYSGAQRFLREVDAAAVYVNASTQFTDGGQFGLGAEVGISTQKMHARGPMGLREMTSYKWVVRGDGHVRPA
ncbi:MAG: glutamate-5-semialdehyde dehydrogenase [Chloroflexi bacterium]|nr:glutamate-5-semialdehyde dehydrogenase [Chloroflexota bacterium]